MAQKKPQNYANHVRFDPWFHYFLAPVLIVTFIWAIVHAAMHPRALTAWAVIFTFALVVLATKARLYALRVQDRVIRLEERLRLKSLLGQPEPAWAADLTVQQWIALRFASDAELPALAERAAKEKLTQKQIKQAIQNWRADAHRV